MRVIDGTNYSSTAEELFYALEHVESCECKNVKPARENMALYANISKAKQMLQWEPAISLDKGLQKTSDCFVYEHD